MATDLTPYAGRWVALVGDHVAGTGNTAEEAHQLASRNRPKERVTLLFVEPTTGTVLPLSPLLDQLRPLLAAKPMPIYLVGGAVRDAVLGRVSHDLDFVLRHDAIKTAFDIANALKVPAYVLDQERDTGRVVLAEASTTLDFARFRGDHLDADLRDRDFTINAMALPATARRSASIIDPCGGLADLASRHIRLTNPQAIASDPVRSLRAIRLALALGFTLTDETARAVSAAASHLGDVSSERVRDELIKLIESRAPHSAVADMNDLGLLEVTLPDVAALVAIPQSAPHHQSALDHTISTLGWLLQIETLLQPETEPDGPFLSKARTALAPFAGKLLDHLRREIDGGIDGKVVLRFAALLHDVGKRRMQPVDDQGHSHFPGHEKAAAAMAAQRLRDLCFSRQAVTCISRVVGNHLAPLVIAREHFSDQGASTPISRRTIYRYFRDSQSAGLDIGLLSLAYYLSTHDGPGDIQRWEYLVDLVAELFRHYLNHHAQTITPQPYFDGIELMKLLDLMPGPRIGRILRYLEEGQAAGEINSVEEAEAAARQAMSLPES